MSGGKDKILTAVKGLAHVTAFAFPLDKLHLKQGAAQDPRFPLLWKKGLQGWVSSGALWSLWLEREAGSGQSWERAFSFPVRVAGVCIFPEWTAVPDSLDKWVTLEKAHHALNLS